METAVSPTPPPPSYLRVWMTEPPLSQHLDPALNSHSGHKSFSKPNEKPKPEGQNYRGAHANMDYLGGGEGFTHPYMSNVCTQANMIYTCVNLYVVSVTPRQYLCYGF